MVAKVLNIRKGSPDGAVYIGRGSEWGNPYKIGVDGTRNQVIAKYEDMIRADEIMMKRAKLLLKGKDLLCFCAPSKCHGDVLLKIANEKD